MILIGRGRIVAQGDKKSLLADRGSATHTSAVDNDALGTALKEAALDVVGAGDGWAVQATTRQVGEIAARHQLVLTELRSSDGGLENLFLELTSDTQRDDLTPGASA